VAIIGPGPWRGRTSANSEARAKVPERQSPGSLRELVRVNTRTGPGYFHMKPNGMLYVAGEFASIVESVLSLYSPE